MLPSVTAVEPLREAVRLLAAVHHNLLVTVRLPTMALDAMALVPLGFEPREVCRWPIVQRLAQLRHATCESGNLTLHVLLGLQPELQKRMVPMSWTLLPLLALRVRPVDISGRLPESAMHRIAH